MPYDPLLPAYDPVSDTWVIGRVVYPEDMARLSTRAALATVATTVAAAQTATQVSAAINTAFTTMPDGTTITLVGGKLAVVGTATVPFVGALVPATDAILVQRGTGTGALTGPATALQVTGLLGLSSGGSGTTPVTTTASATGTQTLAYPATGNAAFDLTLTGATTIALSGGTAGQLQTITLIARQDATAGRVLTLPAGVRWPGGTAPTPGVAVGGVDMFMFTTPDARTTVIGSY